VTKRTLIACVSLVLLICAAAVLRRSLDIEWTTESIRAFVANAGIWAPLLFIGLVAFRAAILVPSQFLLIAAGVLFGATLGTVYGALGMTVSGLMNFAFVRFAGADSIRARFPKRFDAAFALAKSPMGAGAVAIATGYPVGPITVIQLGAAVTGMTLVTYGAAVLLGAFVRAATFSYFGSALLEGRSLLLGAAVIAAAAVIPLLFARSRAWLVASLGANGVDASEERGGEAR
jgi:uncharacterized membrane protein YdjX (TVP38/TMEM64 family)